VLSFSLASRFFFFFQAEDGIRAFHVTGVQTCALPISRLYSSLCIFAYSVSFLPLAHMIGLYNPLVGVTLLGATMTGFVLFDVPRVLVAFALALLVIFILAGLSIAGVIEYAPLLRTDPVTKTHISLYWVASTFLCATPFVASVYFVTIVLLERWRERERRVRILSTTDSLTGLPNRR